MTKDDLGEAWEQLSDEQKQELNEDSLLEDLALEFENDPDTTLSRAEDLGYDIADLPL